MIISNKPIKRNPNYISESDIKSYMEQFKVNREQAIKDVKEIYEEENKKYRGQMEDVYEGIKRSMY